jgi:broad specificity phosphatase PhoE
LSSPSHSAHEVVLVRHGETEWSRAGKHTGRTDVPLTEQGRREAEAVGAALRDRDFALVLTSPLGRAAESCRLAGFGDRAVERDELMEWDYGAYEGRTTLDIRKERPGWSLWRDGVPEGETATQVGERVDRVIAELGSIDGDALLFAHGHLLRVLAARWLGLEPGAGRLFALDPATLSTLGYERETPVMQLWNQPVAV